MTTYSSHYGDVHTNDACKDDWNNIVLYHQDAQRVVKLQKPAMESFKECEKKLGHKIHITGYGWRSCSSQLELWRSNSARYANPNGSMHCDGLAIDLDTTDPHFAENKRTLLNHGWHFPRPDEGWHVSFRVSG